MFGINKYIVLKKVLKNYFTLFVLLCFSINSFSQVPVISSFSPNKGSIGSLVTLMGSNLNAPTSLTIGGISALVVSNTGSQIVAMVMPGSSTGTVSITTAAGTATGSGNFIVEVTLPPFRQQGTKLAGTGSIGGTYQGWSSAISADGNTAIVGGPFDNTSWGAAWIFTRSGSSWTQQGLKLSGYDSIGDPYQGWAVALSANGTTALIGGPSDSGGIGATWVFTRSGNVWTQQGRKLVGTGSIGGQIYQGNSVSLSADGNTALVGGPYDNAFSGAVWVFKRAGNVWAQQGSKITGTGAIGFAAFGYAVSLSADGLTAIAGGFYDNSNIGAAWILKSNGNSWTQQGNKLVGSGSVGATVLQGFSVSLNADGNTAIIGGPGDNNSIGAAWVFTRSGSSWTQQGSKLVGAGYVGSGTNQGNAVTLNADGNICMFSGNYDDSNNGAAWVFTRSGNTWSQNGNKLVGIGNVGAAQQGSSLCISANGSNAIVGGYSDNSLKGAAWIFIPPSSSADLSTFTLSSGSLTPLFSSGVISYNSNVASATTSLTVTATVADAATIQVRVNSGSYIAATSGSPSPVLTLNVGNNVIDVLVTAQDGITSKTYSITVTRACPGVSAVLSGTASVCSGVSANLSVVVTGGLAPFAVIYTGGTLNNYISGSNIPVTPISTTNYSLTSVTDANNCSASTSGNPIITVKTNAGISSVTAAINPVCQGRTTTLTANGITGTNASVTWRDGAGGTGSILGTGSSLNNVGSGTYHARVSGDCGIPAEATITITSNPVPSVTNQSDNICSGNTFIINPTGVPVGTTYSWNTPVYAGSISGGSTQTGQTNISQTLTNTDVASGTATYTVTPVSGTCSGNSFLATVTVFSRPIPSFDVSPSGSTCLNSNCVYSTQAGMANYVWSIPGVLGSDYSIENGSLNTTSNAVTIKWLTIGNKIVTVNYKDGNNCSGLTSASASTTITAGQTPTVSIRVTAGTNPVCLNGSVTFTATPVNGGATPSYQWYKNNVLDPSTISDTYTLSGISNASTTVYAIMTVSSGSCVTSNTASSSTTTVILVGNSWTGSYSNLWSDGRNWCKGSIPTSNSDISIPVTSRNPVITGHTSVNNIILATGVSVTMSNCTLTVNGTVTGDGLFGGIGNSGLTLTSTGNVGTLYFSPDGIGALKFTGANASATLGNATNIYNELNVGSATLNTGEKLTLKSNANGTSWVGPITGGSILGNVIVERYIPQNGFRAWRLLSVPVKGTITFKQAWQENQLPLANGIPGYGTLLTSSIAGNGFDAQTAGNSLLQFSNGNPGSFSGVTNTNNAMVTNGGYFVYIRGDRSVGIQIGVFNPGATTLRTKGILYTGTQPVIALPIGQNILVGNIYACPVNFDNLARSGVNAFKVWDPKLQGTYNVGGYQTFSSINGYDPIPGGGSYGSIASSRIESGQSFLVNSQVGGSIQFTESAKDIGSRNVFKGSSYIRQFKTNLYANSGIEKVLTDGNVVVFDDEYNNGIDKGDVIKTTNFGENLGILSNEKLWVIESRQPIKDEDVLQYDLTNLKPQSYTFEFIPKNMETGLVAYIEDKYLKTKKLISLYKNTRLSFNITNDTASSSKGRFKVWFKKIDPISFISLGALEKDNKVILDWTVEGQKEIQQYIIEQSIDNTAFLKIGSVSAVYNGFRVTSYTMVHTTPVFGNNYYRIKSISKTGKIVYSRIAKVFIGSIKGSFAISPNPVTNGILNIQFTGQPKGRYGVRLINNAGQESFSQTIEHNGVDNKYQIIFSSKPTQGLYQLEIVKPNKEKYIEHLVISYE